MDPARVFSGFHIAVAPIGLSSSWVQLVVSWRGCQRLHVHAPAQAARWLEDEGADGRENARDAAAGQHTLREL